MTELETKLEVSAESLHQLLNTCQVLGEHEQLNVYYDYEEELASRATTLRLRYEKQATPRFTLKLPIGMESGRRTALELEVPSHRTLPARWLALEELAPSFRTHLAEIGVARVRRLGSMRTCRVDARLPSGLPVELDTVQLPGGAVFCEIEIESNDVAVHEAAVAEIARIVGEFKISRQSKFERFASAIRADPASAKGERGADDLSGSPS